MKKISCIIVDDEPIAREILERHIAKISVLELIKSCKNANEALETINSKDINLVFLDIHMPNISGISLAQSLTPKVKIIFTTAHREYAIDGFDLQAVDYLLKPISFDRFITAVNRYVNSLEKKTRESEQEEDERKFIFVRSDRKMIKVIFDDVEYLESLGDYIRIITSDTTILTRQTISSIAQMLPQGQFLRIHRSYIINLEKITSYSNEFVLLSQKQIPISRSYKESTFDVLEKL